MVGGRQVLHTVEFAADRTARSRLLTPDGDWVEGGPPVGSRWAVRTGVIEVTYPKRFDPPTWLADRLHGRNGSGARHEQLVIESVTADRLVVRVPAEPPFALEFQRVPEVVP